MDLTMHLFVIALLSVAVIGLAVYKRTLGSDEEEYLHLHDSNLGASAVSQQAALSARLEKLDRAMMVMIALLVIYGVGIGGSLLYHEWNSGGGAAEQSSR